MKAPDRPGGTPPVEAGFQRGLGGSGKASDRPSDKPARPGEVTTLPGESALPRAALPLIGPVAVLTRLVATVIVTWSVGWLLCTPLQLRREAVLVDSFLVPTREVEIADESRPVARRDVVEAKAGSARVRTGAFIVPARAGLEAWAGLAGAAGGEASAELTVWGEGQRLAGRRVRLAPAAATSPRWIDLELDLDDLAGRHVEIELVLTAPGLEAAALMPGAPRFIERRPVPGRARNVILVSLDTLRADRLGSYGHSRATSPVLDAMARAGGRAAVALAHATSTPPSHMSMLTGTLPCRHGVFGVHVEDDLPEDVDTLAGYLSRHGWTTAAVTEDAFVGAPYGFPRGFDRYRELKQTVAAGNEVSPGMITPTGYGPRTFRTAEHWLEDNGERLFFLFVHTYQMHGPRRPEAPWRDLFPSSLAPGQTQRSPEFHDLGRYDALVRQVDSLVGGLLDTVASQGLARETIVVVTSDHGEAFFEHGTAGHGHFVWEEETRVPLLFYAPGLLPPRVVAEPVGLVDLVPTVLDLVGLPVPAGLDGRSLAGALEHGSPLPLDRALYVEPAPGAFRAVRDARWKIVRDAESKVDTVFDLAADPHERNGATAGMMLSPGYTEQARLDRLRRALDTHEAACLARRARSERERRGERQLDAARAEKLRALGYLP